MNQLETLNLKNKPLIVISQLQRVGEGSVGIYSVSSVGKVPETNPETSSKYIFF